MTMDFSLHMNTIYSMDIICSLFCSGLLDGISMIKLHLIAGGGGGTYTSSDL